MAQAKQTTHNFNGRRIQVDSVLPFEAVLERLDSSCGKTTVPEINELAEKMGSVEEFAAAVKSRFEGPSGFMIFSLIEHTRWTSRYGLNQRVTRVVFGNPLLAITMMREDISAGLFVPPELLIVSTPEGSTVHYVQPSSLLMIEPNALLQKAAEQLDAKIGALVSSITKN